MTISFPLTPPSSPAPRVVNWTPVSAVARTSSPFTLQQQIQAHQGQMWRCRFELPPMLDSAAEAWIAFLLSLNGMEGTFLWGDSVLKAPRGSGSGSPLVKGAGQIGSVLTTDAWTVSTNGLLLKGDWIQLGSGSTTRAHKSLIDVNSDSGGNALIDIWPRLRESPADNAALVLSSAKMVMRLADNEMDWSFDRVKHFGLEIDAIEAI